VGYLVGQRLVEPGVQLSGIENMATVETNSGVLVPVGMGALTEIPNVKATGISRAASYQKQSSDITRVAPHFYDPRYQHTTLAIPTDERTLHGLYRFFDDHDPLIGNSIRLHAEFPLSDFRLGDCGDRGIQGHFEEMWEERLHGDQLLMDATLEFWRIGNVFLFGAWNSTDYMWDQFAILNPDYVNVQATWISQRPLITLQPDEGLQKVVQTQQPKYIFDQLPPEIIRYVRLNQEIPLDPNNVFHLAFNKAPYEKLGKSLIKRLLRLLMYEDRLYQAQFAIATRHIVPLTVVKVGDPNLGWIPHDSELESLREMFAAYELDPNFCYDEETECLTDCGWKRYDDLTYDDKIASFNPETNGLEYHHPDVITIQDYEGDMYHFKGKGYDIKVTPNHRMWVERDDKWQVVQAHEVRARDTFRAVVDDYEGEELPETVEIAGEQVRTEDWFEFVGWYLAEGSIFHNKHYGGNPYGTTTTQYDERYVPEICSLLDRLPFTWKLHEYGHHVIHNVELGRYIEAQLGCGSTNKRVPRWMLNAKKPLLQKLLDAWVAGDGASWEKGDGDTFITAASVSEQFVDDMQEVALKLGYGVKKRTDSYLQTSDGVKHYNRKDGSKYHDIHHLHISKGRQMSFPGVSRYKASRPSEPLVIENIRGVEFYSDHIKAEPYQGKIWCVGVPSGLFLTRRNGRISVQGNTLFYHWGIDVVYYGASGKILPTGPEFERLQKLKFIGMGINESLITGQGTYANAYASLQVLKQRYLNLQLKLENFIHNGLFLPVAEAAGFYKTEGKFTSGVTYSGRAHGSSKIQRYADERRELLASFTTLRDNQDNQAFSRFIRRKALERAADRGRERIEYIYPEIRWGQMSMTQDSAIAGLYQALKENPRFAHLITEEAVADAFHLDREKEMQKVIEERVQYKEWAEEYNRQTGEWPPGYQQQGAGDVSELAGGEGMMGPPKIDMGGEGGEEAEGFDLTDVPGIEAAPAGEVLEGPPAAPVGAGAAGEAAAAMQGDFQKAGVDETVIVEAENKHLLKKKSRQR